MDDFCCRAFTRFQLHQSGECSQKFDESFAVLSNFKNEKCPTKKTQTPTTTTFSLSCKCTSLAFIKGKACPPYPAHLLWPPPLWSKHKSTYILAQLTASHKEKKAHKFCCRPDQLSSYCQHCTTSSSGPLSSLVG